VVRNVWIGIIGAMVVLAVLGSAASRPTIDEPGGPNGPVPSDDVSAPETSSPTPPTTTVLSLSGTGAMTSDPFQASGDSVDVKYQYTCTPEDSFTLNFYGAGASPALPDVLVSDFGATGSGTVSESLNAAPGPFRVETDTVCDWSIEVLGAP
jgi:hypothetical protein